MISERLHDVQEVQEHLGGRQVAGPCGWTTSCRCHLNWAQYQMKRQHGRHDVGETSVEGEGRKKASHKLSESQGGKTHNTSWWRMTSVLPVAEAEAVAGYEIRGLSRHLVKQQAATMPSPPARELGGPKLVGSLYHHGSQAHNLKRFQPTPSCRAMISRKSLLR